MDEPVPTHAMQPMLQDQNKNANIPAPATNETRQNPNGDAHDTIENPIDNGSSPAHLEKPAAMNKILQDQKAGNVDTPTNVRAQGQDGNVDIEKLQTDETKYKHLVEHFNFRTVLSIFAYLIAKPNGRLITLLDKPAPTNEMKQDQEQNTDLEKDKPDETQYKYLVEHFNFKTLLSIFGYLIAKSNGGLVAHLDKPASRNEMMQDQLDRDAESTAGSSGDNVHFTTKLAPTNEAEDQERNADHEGDQTKYKYLEEHFNIKTVLSIFAYLIAMLSSVTRLDKPAATDEVQQGQERNNDPEQHDANETQYKYLMERFNFKAMISIFACSLVVAYMTFVNNAVRTISRIHYAHGTPYNIFLFLAYLSISLHALSGIISIKCAVLCSDSDLIKEKKYTVDKFKDTLSLCQHLALRGIILFFLAVLNSSFFVFEDNAYPAMFCGVTLVLMLKGKYRKSDLTQIWNT